jgi:hypothetical protein
MPDGTRAAGRVLSVGNTMALVRLDTGDEFDVRWPYVGRPRAVEA